MYTQLNEAKPAIDNAAAKRIGMSYVHLIRCTVMSRGSQRRIGEWEHVDLFSVR